MNRSRSLLLLLGVVVLGALSTGAGHLVTGRSYDSQPTCSADYRGKFWTEEGGASTADLHYVCAKNGAGSYAWYAVPAVTATVTPINLAAIAPNACSQTSITWTGVTAGETVTVNVDSASSLAYNVNATATNTLTLNACAHVSSIDSGNINYRFERRLR